MSPLRASTLALFAVLPMSACAVSCANLKGESTPELEDVVLTDGTRVGGTLHVRTLLVPEHATVYVLDDFTVHAEETVWIDGELVAIDRRLDDPTIDAADIEIVTQDFVMTGEIIGGKGRNHDHLPVAEGGGLRGGDGSSITIRSRRYAFRGTIRGGPGGTAGFGGKGGSGGDVVVVGNPPPGRLMRHGKELFGGALIGGLAGEAGTAHREVNNGTGGDGGDGGSAIFEAVDDGS